MVATMKITLVQYKKSYSVEESRDDLDIFEVCTLLRGLLIAAGFDTDSVHKVLPEVE